MRVNLKKLTKREIDFHCKNYEEAEASNDRKEDCIDNGFSLSNMGSIPFTPRKAPKRTESRSRLSSSKKKMSAVKKRTGGSERSVFDIGSLLAPAAALRNDSKEVEEEDPMFFGSPKQRRDPVVKTPTATPNKSKLKEFRVVIRQTKENAKTLRNLSQEYLREAKEETKRKKTVGMEKDHDSGTDLSPPIIKSQSDIFSSQLEVPQPSPALMLGKLVNENISSDEEDPSPSLVMNVSRDLFSQNQSQEDVNANNPQQEEEEEYRCLLCDEAFKEETDHEKHVKVCMSRRPAPAPSLPPSSSKLKRPRSPSPSPLSRAPGASAAPMMTSAAPLMASAAPLAPTSPPRASDLLPPSVHKPKLAKIPKLKVSPTEEADITVVVTNSFAFREHLRS